MEQTKESVTLNIQLTYTQYGPKRGGEDRSWEKRFEKCLLNGKDVTLNHIRELIVKIQ